MYYSPGIFFENIIFKIDKEKSLTNINQQGNTRGKISAIVDPSIIRGYYKIKKSENLVHFTQINTRPFLTNTGGGGSSV